MPFEPSSAPLKEKLMDAFDEMVLYKDLSKGNIFSSFKLPSFMRDWVMKKFQDDEGQLDIEEASEFIRPQAGIASIHFPDPAIRREW